MTTARRMSLPAKLGVAVLALSLFGAMSAVVFAAVYDNKTAPIVGPCASRVASDSTYRQLALDMIYPRIGPGLLPDSATPERVRQAHATYASLRREFLPTVADACLRSYVADWLDYYEGDADRMAADRLRAPAERDDYEARKARERDEVHALAEKLGVRP